eukprot:gene17098-18818_t
MEQDSPSAQIEVTIPTTNKAGDTEYANMLARLEHRQNEKIKQISDKFEASIQRLTGVLAVFTQDNCKLSRKRTLSDHGSEGDVDDVSPGPSTKVARARPESDCPNTPEVDYEDVISLPEQDDLDKDVENLLVGPAVGNTTPDPLLDTIAEELEQNEAFSEKISEKLATIVNELFCKKLSKETLNKKLDKYKTPENLRESQFFPKVNPEIWANNLETESRTIDLNFQRFQKDLLKITAAQSMIANELLTYKSQNASRPEINNIIIMATDTLALLGNLQQEMSQCRRDAMKHKLPSMYQQLVHNVPPGSKMLFRDDLNKRLQSMSTTNKALAYTKPIHGKQWQKHTNFAKNRLPPQRSPVYGKRGMYRRGRSSRGNYRGNHQSKPTQQQ